MAQNTVAITAQELIQISPTRTVNARDVHAQLGIAKDFSDWMKVQLNRGGFEKGVDYTTAENLSTPKKGSSNSRAQATIDYHLTVEAAKHIAMMSSTPAGRLVRNYFIECERKLKAQQRLESFTMSAVAALDDTVLDFLLKRAVKDVKSEVTQFATFKTRRFLTRLTNKDIERWERNGLEPLDMLAARLDLYLKHAMNLLKVGAGLDEDLEWRLEGKATTTPLLGTLRTPKKAKPKTISHTTK